MKISNKSVLVLGSGGREHAICWKLSKSEHIENIFVIPGSPGISKTQKVTNVTNIELKDFNGIVIFCKEKSIDLVIVGSEDPLAQGIRDVLNENHILCFGPGKAGAQIESDKDWSKSFMIRNDIPTARYESFTDADKAKDYIKNADFEALVVKASGLAAGKGVIVAENILEACQAVDEILGDKKFGSAGDVVIVEEKLSGEEVSCLAFVDETTVRIMLPAQDHKRLENNDNGPNTGGMGAYCPCPLIKECEMEMVLHNVLEKAIHGLKKEGIKYCGVLYAGMMLTQQGPKTLEFNCRFGDPETQVILPLLESDLYEVMSACANNTLSSLDLKWKKNTSAVGVIMASKGYPETSTKGCVIKGIDKVDGQNNHIVFHSGVAKNDQNEFTTNGGRVLINVVLSQDLKTSAKLATAACSTIKFYGSQFRTDIAHKAFKPMQSYKNSGVDIEAGDLLVQRIKPLARGTNRSGVIDELGSFGGLFRLNDVKYKNEAGEEVNYKDPVLVQGTDGVGTKLKIAKEMGIWESIGIDLVAMCANDVLCAGAEPLAFLDYIACGKLEVPSAAMIVKGISEGCRESGCALIGGETAEMPAIYSPGKYDLAGYCLGIVEYENILPKVETICEGDLIIGIPSSGIHSNGFSLVNKIMGLTNEKFTSPAPFSKEKLTFGREFLKPTRLYIKPVLPLIRKGTVKALAHITGGGLTENIPRVLPENLSVRLDANNFKIHPVFGWLAAKGNVTDDEMLRTFNCGVGMILIVSAEDKNYQDLSKFGATVIGRVEKRNGTEKQVVVENFSLVMKSVADQYRNEEDSKRISTSYKDSGVDIIAGDDLVKTIKPMAKTTKRKGEIGGLGGFGGLFRLNDFQLFKDPILVMGTDGVGTKLKIAQETKKHDTIGVDLVAMCANDILCNGAEPLTFLDYFACGKLDREVAGTVISGIAEGCRQSGSVLLGGETAEMPGMYSAGVYDVAGFSLGIVENEAKLPKINQIKFSDVIIGLPSNGLHSNGFSLVHRIMEINGHTLSDKAPFSQCGKTFGEELLAPTKLYVDAVLPLLKAGLVKAIAHITGGGLLLNIPRVLPKNLATRLDANQFNIPPVFGWLSSKGSIADLEMQRIFNCGIGMVLVVSQEKQNLVLAQLCGHGATAIGNVIERVPPTESRPRPRVTVDNFTSCLERVQDVLFNLKKKRVGVLISGNGSNLQALIDATKNTNMGIGAEIVYVISNKSDAFGLKRAEKAGIKTKIVENKNFKSREEFDEVITKEFEDEKIDIICLAGFMRIVSSDFVRKWRGRLINIHPSLLPKYKGMNAQKQALDSGDEFTGCSVHFVDETVDTGAVIVQEICQIVPGDSIQDLEQRIHRVEHVAFPKALRLLATGAVQMTNTGDVQWN